MSNHSVQLYSIRQDFAVDPASVLRRVAEIGLTQVEPYGVVENVEALRLGLPANGLTAPTAHARLLGADQEAVFAAAAELGIGVVIDPLVKPELWLDRADIAATASALNDAAKLASPHGVRVGYHNHWWELESQIDGRSALELFVDQLDPEIVLEIDTYWATAGGENAAALLGRLGSRVHAIHVKDGGLNRDGSGQVPAGQGQIPLPEVLAAAPDALHVIEFDAFDGDVYEAIAASYAYLTAAE